SIAELLIALCSQPVPPLLERAPWVDPRIAAAVERALVVDRDKRYQSAAEMGSALAALIPDGSTTLNVSMLRPADRRAGSSPPIAPTRPGETQAPLSQPISAQQTPSQQAPSQQAPSQQYVGQQIFTQQAFTQQALAQQASTQQAYAPAPVIASTPRPAKSG